MRKHLPRAGERRTLPAVLAVEQPRLSPSRIAQRQRIPVVLPPVVLDVHEVSGQMRTGGLLARTDMIYTNGTMAASYQYDPFGNTTSMSGPLAAANRYRFSSKEWDDAAGLYYYGFRFYDPNLQRWLNRDPLGELGFVTMGKTKLLPMLLNYKADETMNEIGTYIYNQFLVGKEDENNLYDFVANNPISKVDIWGLSCWCDHSEDRDLESCMLCAAQNSLMRQEPPGRQA